MRSSYLNLIEKLAKLTGTSPPPPKKREFLIITTYWEKTCFFFLFSDSLKWILKEKRSTCSIRRPILILNKNGLTQAMWNVNFSESDQKFVQLNGSFHFVIVFGTSTTHVCPFWCYFEQNLRHLCPKKSD